MSSGYIIPCKFYNPPYYPNLFNSDKKKWINEVLDDKRRSYKLLLQHKKP